ncbi:hypothetical protein EG329_000718 [Mollisiaceae sp. DMI_Dod_QoI]|nr:hypothetical protein EG329_000718 [Helotiales sp. DMI_Dod_QoI]
MAVQSVVIGSAASKLMETVFLLFLFFAISDAFSQDNPTRSLTSQDLRLRGVEEEGNNPVKPKIPTRPDPGMEYPNYNVLAEDKTWVWNSADWSMAETKFKPGIFYTRIFSANGYYGTTFAAAGPFFEREVNQTNINGDIPLEGWPVDNIRQSFGTVSGFWDCQVNTTRTNFYDIDARGCESLISGLPHPMGLYLTIGDETLNSTVDPATISNFSESLSFRNGIVSWDYTWSPKNTDISYGINMVSFVSRSKRNVAATRLSVTPRGGNSNASIADFIDGRGGDRSYLNSKGVDANTSSVYVSVHPDGLEYVTGWLASTANVSNGYTDETSRRPINGTDENDTMSIGQAWDVNLIDGETATFEKFIGISSTDGFPTDAEDVARTASSTALENGWDNLYNEHVETWNSIMDETTITSFADPATGSLPDDPVLEMYQIHEISGKFYLLSNVQADDGSGLNDNGVSVAGLTADAYGGMLFWDQDFWMWPSMGLTHPDLAKQIIKSRDKFFPAAKANAQEDYVQAKYNLNEESSLYPWTGGRFGNATGTGPALDYEYHLDADIALAAIYDFFISGNKTDFMENRWERVKSCVNTFMGLAIPDGDGYSIRNVTEPDEYAVWKDNGAFTNAAFASLTNMTIALQRQFGEQINETWAEVAAKIIIPKAESGITHEYEGMDNTVHIKQADVTLMIYPLSLNWTLEQKAKDLAYYNQRAEPDGPGMTAAIAAVAENLVAPSGCAASFYISQAMAPFLRGPWYQMSEQANDDMNGNGGIAPAFPFLTGHGGALQFPHFGLLAVNLNNETLHIRPSLPPPFTHVQLADFYFQGNRFRAIMNTTHTTLTRLQNIRVSGLVDIYEGQPMPIVVERRNEAMTDLVTATHMLSMDETVTIENDMYWQNLTTDDNILQCQPAITKASNVLGQYPGAINDGDAGTRFQPTSRNLTSLVIDSSKSAGQRIERFRIDWGRRPANSFTLAFTNSTESNIAADNQTAFTFDVTPSLPYGVNMSLIEVVPYQGNVTEHIFGENEQIWSGDFTILEFEGCKDCGGVDTLGATVGEVEVIAFRD